MAKIPPGSSQFPGRGVSLRGQFYTVVDGDKVIVKKWPRRQPTARTAGEQANRELLAKAARFTAYMSAGSQQFARELADRNRLLPRDFLMIALFNRIGYPIMPDGRKIYSMAAMGDVSNLLDAIGQVKGDLMIRGDDYWIRVPKGAASQVLKSKADGLVEWADNLAPTTGLEAFQQPHLTPTLTTGLFGTGAFAGRSTWLPANTVCNGIRVGVKTLNTGGTIRAGLYSADPTNLDLGGGTLRAQSATINLALGIMSLPFSSPYTIPADGWYWFGVGILGTGNPNLMAGDYARANEFWASLSFPLPTTAPSTTASSSVNSFWWLY